jgi:hypothetical protein
LPTRPWAAGQPGLQRDLNANITRPWLIPGPRCRSLSPVLPRSQPRGGDACTPHGASRVSRARQHPLTRGPERLPGFALTLALRLVTSQGGGPAWGAPGCAGTRDGRKRRCPVCS